MFAPSPLKKISKSLFLYQKEWLFILMLFWALLLRSPAVGHPLLQQDEDWYLYVGGQITQGYFPYIDLWDRKPFGIFALYAIFHLFGAWRFWAYLLAAAFSVWFTAILIFKFGEKITKSVWAGFFTGLFYIAIMNIREGWGGQTPVFYNFLMAAAFFLVFRFKNKEETHPRISTSLRKTGIFAMFLVGLALEIKPACIIEGIYLGCFLLYCTWQETKKVQISFLNAGLWVSAAFLPTFFIASAYFLTGHGYEWWFCNILSIFHKTAIADQPSIRALFNVYKMAALFTALNASILFLEKLRPLYGSFIFLIGWLFSACFAVWLIPPYWSHYSLPIFLPLSIVASFLWYALAGRVLLILSVVYFSFLGEKRMKIDLFAYPSYLYAESQKVISEDPGCLFEYQTHYILLDALPNLAKCHLTKYSYPYHLGQYDEQNALGISPVSELSRILHKKPKWIGTSLDFSQKDNQKTETDRLVLQALQDDYILKYYTPSKNHGFFYLYERR